MAIETPLLFILPRNRLLLNNVLNFFTDNFFNIYIYLFVENPLNANYQKVNVQRDRFKRT